MRRGGFRVGRKSPFALSPPSIGALLIEYQTKPLMNAALWSDSPNPESFQTSLQSADDCMTLDPSFITLYFRKDSQEKKKYNWLLHLQRFTCFLDIPSPKLHDLVLGSLTFAIWHNLSNILLHLFTIASMTSQWRNKFQANQKM